METLLIALKETNSIDEGYIAKRLKLSVDEYKQLESGEKRITVDIARGLSSIFKVAPEYFFQKESTVAHHNIGIGSNSNSGYINTYQNYPPELLKELLKSGKK